MDESIAVKPQIKEESLSADTITETVKQTVLSPDLIAKINNAIDNAPMGLGSTVRNYLNAQVPELQAILEGNLQNAQEGGKFESGRANADSYEEVPERISSSTWSEILSYMSDLDSKGFTPGRIADDVLQEYGVDMHPLKIKKTLEEYYRKADLNENVIDEPQTNNLKIVSSLLAKNTKLQEKIKELELKLPIMPLPLPQEKKYGLLRRFLLWLI